MLKFFVLSPKSLPLNQVLFPSFVQTFWAAGHEFTTNIREADIVLWDLHSRLADYDSDDVMWLAQSETKIATFDEWDRGSMSNDIWPAPLTNQQLYLWRTIKHRSVHFCRLFNKTYSIPPNLYPYEKAILHDESPVSKDELFYRQFDVTFIANSSPNRERLKQILEQDGRIKCNIVLGAPQIPFDNWIDEARKAKFFVTCSAGGFTDQRMQALFSISAQIREDTDQLLLHDFTHGKNCIKISREPTKQDLDTIYDIANNKERLYDIYLNCIEFVKTYYTKEYIAKDVLDKITKHLWEK